MTYIEGTPLRLRIGTAWVELTILGEVAVLFTRRGYAPVLEVLRQQAPHVIFVSAASLAEPLERLRQERGRLEGATIRVRKAGGNPTDPYEVQVV